MYSAGAPSAGAAPALVSVRGAWRRAFDEAPDAAPDPALGVYLADMLRPHGQSLVQERLGQEHSYGQMAGALLAEDVAADGPVDLLVFAFAVPDAAPWRATASYLSHLCPGGPFAFAVCDAGATAPFTALRLIREYVSTGGCRRALLVVAEQAAIPYQPPVGVAMPARNAVVTLLCDQSGPGHVAAVRLYPGIDPPRARVLLSGAAADLSAGHDLVTVLGAGLTADLCAGLPGEVVTAPPGQPCTGVWWEVAGGLSGWTDRAGRDRRVLLADYDPLLGQLCLATIEISRERS